MPRPKDEEHHSDKENGDRFVAALKGARIAGHKPMESLTQKKRKPRIKKAKKGKSAMQT
jgi:hypothetical protein